MSCRPCDRCYSCQPVTVHWGHAVIDLDTTLNVWGKKAASWVRGGERIPSGCYRQTSGHHCCSTAVYIDSYKYWPFELTCCHHWIPCSYHIIISQLTNDFILEKGCLSQDQKPSTASMTLRTFLCLLNERISILMTTFIKCFLILNSLFFVRMLSFIMISEPLKD